MLGDVEETKKQIRVSIGLIIAVAVISATIGAGMVKIIDNDEQRLEQKEFLLEEIHGLRNDMNREIEIIERENTRVREWIKNVGNKKK